MVFPCWDFSRPEKKTQSKLDQAFAIKQTYEIPVERLPSRTITQCDELNRTMGYFHGKFGMFCEKHPSQLEGGVVSGAQARQKGDNKRTYSLALIIKEIHSKFFGSSPRRIYMKWKVDDVSRVQQGVHDFFASHLFSSCLLQSSKNVVELSLSCGVLSCTFLWGDGRSWRRSFAFSLAVRVPGIPV